MGLLVTLVAATLLVGGFTVQNVTIVYWTGAPISPYGILLFANIFFPLFFGSLLLGYAWWTRDWRALAVADDPAQRSLLRCGSLAQIAAAVGLLNILNGFLIVYASPPDRTPPLIQAVLQNSGVVFSVPASILVLGDRKAYASREPLAAGALVAASIAVSVLPTVLAGTAGEGFSGSTTIGWIAVYLLGIAPGAAYNVVQQLFLIRSGALAPGVSRADVAKASLRALFWCNLSQSTWLVLLWWVDILPWFGASTSVSEFWDNTVFSLTCSVGGPGAAADGDAGQCVSHFATPQLWAFLFAAGYSTSYLGSVLLNRESASFNMVCAVITTALTSLYFLLPGTNSNASNTPLWSVLVSLSLSLAGLVLWKRWEARTPAEDQFAAADAYAGGTPQGKAAAGADGGDDDGDGDAFFAAPRGDGGRAPSAQFASAHEEEDVAGVSGGRPLYKAPLLGARGGGGGRG